MAWVSTGACLYSAHVITFWAFTKDGLDDSYSSFKYLNPLKFGGLAKQIPDQLGVEKCPFGACVRVSRPTIANYSHPGVGRCR